MIELILGLGNIGREYSATRHNAGFEVVVRLETMLKAKPQAQTPLYDWSTVVIDGQKKILARPRTYMNRSGIAGLELLERLEITPDQMLVVVDDFNLPLGSLRFRLQGSDGGHNGLQSLIDVLETRNFPRLRLGIGPVADNTDAADYVLAPFGPKERPAAEKMFDSAAAAVYYAMRHRLEEAMSKFNSTPALPE